MFCVNPLIRMLNRLGQVVIAVISGWAMLNGTMTVGVVQAFFQYINQTAEPLTEGASYMINSLQSAFASAKRTFELLDERRRSPTPPPPPWWRRPWAAWPSSTSASATSPTAC